MKKISLKNNANALSRNEMRNIAGGSDPWTIDPGTIISCGDNCGTDGDGLTCTGNTQCPRCTKPLGTSYYRCTA